jgi:tetratricopeptide (TPR) repeat protein
VSSAANDYFKKAEQAAKKQNFDYAIELYLQGLIIDPAASPARRALHQIETVAIQEKGGNPQGGFATKLKTGGILAKVKKLEMQKKWDEAVLEYEKCLRFQPQSTPTLFGLATALENQGVPEAAITVLEEIVELDRAHVEAYRKLGQLWAAKEEPEKAIAYWEKVKQYKPDDKEASKAVRDLSAATMVKRAEERKQQTGDESFRALVKSEEESAELEQRAKIIRTDEDRLQAIKFKKEDLRKDPENSRLWRDLGGLYQDLKKWDHALAAYKKALEVNPQDLFAGERIGVLQEVRLQEQVGHLRERLEAAGTNGDRCEDLQKELEAKESQFLAFQLKEYARRVKAHPTDYELKMSYGDVLMRAGEYDEAIGQFQKAVKDPKFKVACHNKIGKCFESKKLYDLADGQYKHALGGIADPDSELAKDVKYNLGVVAEKKGDTAIALKYFQEIMATDINYRDVSGRVTRLMP